MCISAIMTTVMNIPTILFFKGKKLSFPSESALNTKEIEFKMLKDAKELIKKRII